MVLFHAGLCVRSFLTTMIIADDLSVFRPRLPASTEETLRVLDFGDGSGVRDAYFFTV